MKINRFVFCIISIKVLLIALIIVYRPSIFGLAFNELLTENQPLAVVSTAPASTNPLRWFDTTRDVDEDVIAAIRNASIQEIDSPNESGFTGLMMYAANGNKDVVKAFLERGANPFLQRQNDYRGFTALHYALFYYAAERPDNLLIAQMLYQAGVPLYIRGVLGETPLMAALEIYDLNLRMAVTRWMVDEGMQINDQDMYGNTMLHDAVQNQDKYWIIEFRKRYANLINNLIRNDLDRTVSGYMADPALVDASQRSNRRSYTLEEFADALGYNDDEDSIGTALKYPAKIIGQGFYGFREVDENGITALMYAIYRGDIQQAADYIERGAPINAAARDGRTALHYAMSSVRPVEAIDLLLKKGAAVNAKDIYGRTPLLMLMRIESPMGRFKAIELLRQKGADIKATDARGKTIIDLAALQRDTNLVMALTKWRDQK